jgi:hypothetical protein
MYFIAGTSVDVHKYPANFRFNRPTRKQRKLAKEASEDMEITSNMVYSIQLMISENGKFHMKS